MADNETIADIVAEMREAAYANPAQMPYEEGGGNGK